MRFLCCGLRTLSRHRRSFRSRRAAVVCFNEGSASIIFRSNTWLVHTWNNLYFRCNNSVLKKLFVFSLQRRGNRASRGIHVWEMWDRVRLTMGRHFVCFKFKFKDDLRFDSYFWLVSYYHFAVHLLVKIAKLYYHLIGYFTLTQDLGMKLFWVMADGG